MPDNLDTKAQKRYSRWVTGATAMVMAPAPAESPYLKVSFPDPWSPAVAYRLYSNYFKVQKAGLGFGMLNDKSLDGLFLNLLLNEELDITPWGRAFRSYALDTPIEGDKVWLSRMPFFLLPQECVVTGESLGLNGNTFNSQQGHPKGKIHILEAKDTWKSWKPKISEAFEVFERLKEVQGNRDALLRRHKDNYSILWEAYKIISEKAEEPYTPRYQLFEAYKDIEFPELFWNLFLFRLGRDEPINIEGWPPCFSRSLDGKRITDFEDANGQPVTFDGTPLAPENFITLKQLDDFFIVL